MKGAEGLHRRVESRVFHHDLASLWGMGPESEERSNEVVCYRAGDDSAELDSVGC